jgi:hypothetical protein
MHKKFAFFEHILIAQWFNPRYRKVSTISGKSTVAADGGAEGGS